MSLELKVTQEIGKLAQIRRMADLMARDRSTDPSVPAALAKAYSSTGEYVAASRHLARAVELAPGHPGLNHDLGVSLEFLGDFAGAAAAYRRAIELAPDFYRPYAALVLLEKQTADDNRIAELERLFKGPDPDGLRTLHVGHALAKTYEDLGDLPTAFHWLERAKQKRGSLSPYSAAAQLRMFAAAARTADRPPPGGSGHNSAEPIFIVGLPRTGTTLVDRILSSHPQVASAGELRQLFKLLMLMTQNGGIDAALFEKSMRLDLARFGRAYVESTRPLTGQTPRFIDKAPVNFLAAALINRALPESRIVCLKRNPMDSVLGNFRQMIATPSAAYNYVYSLENTAYHYVMFDQLARHWRETLPADRYTEVAYEELVADQEGQTRRLLGFCDLSWDDRCLSFHEHAGAVATPSAVQVRSPVYKSAIGRWKAYGALLDPARRILMEAGLISETGEPTSPAAP